MQTVRLHTPDGMTTALLGKPGRVYTPFVRIDSPSSGPFIRLYKIANGDVPLFTVPLHIGHGKNWRPYPITRMANHMLRVGRANGITKGARTLLNKAKAAA